MKMKWNIVGNNFTHRSKGHTGRCATHGKLPKHVEWCFRREAEITFYTDANMIRGLGDHDDRLKFGWLLESRSIRPRVLDEIKRNYPKYFEQYRCIFTHNRELTALDDRFKFCPAHGTWIQDMAVHAKDSLVSMISSSKTWCEGHKWRMDFIERNRQHLELFGNQFHHIPRKEIGLNRFMFSVAIENGFYATYFTEKILDCFATGTIPIYRGAPDIGDLFNPDGILFIDDDFRLEDLSPDLYYSKFDAVCDNFDRVQEYEIAEDWIFRKYRPLFEHDATPGKPAGANADAIGQKHT